VGGTKISVRFLVVFILPPTALGGKLTWLGDGGKGVRGSAPSSPGGVWGRAPAVGSPGGKTPGKIFEILNAHSCVLVHFKAIN
jgi:hypothetical protein